MEHIHNVIPDPYRKCLWIFSGDFGDNAAIWKVTENFGKVERAFYGDQKYRACVVHALPEGLLYATDSPVDKDFIFLFNPESGELKEIMPIAGSCIYGCKWKDKYVFERMPAIRHLPVRSRQVSVWREQWRDLVVSARGSQEGGYGAYRL